MRRKFGLAAVLLLLASADVHAQNNAIDSLGHLLAAAQDPARRLALLAALSDSLSMIDVEQAIAYAKEGQALARQVDSTRRAAQFDLRIGEFFHDLSQYDSSLVYLEKALARFEAVGDRTGQANTLHRFEFNYKNQGEYVRAMEYGLRALRLWEDLGDEQGIAGAYTQISDELYYQERYEEAVSYCERAIAIHQRLGDTEGLAEDYQYLGENHIMLGHYDEALATLSRALELRGTLENHPTQLASLYNSRGNAFKHMARYEEALADYQQSLDLILPLNHQAGISAIKANIGDVLIRQGAHAEALPYILESIRIQEATNFMMNLSENYLHAARIYEALNQYDQALAYHKKFATTRDSLLNMEKDRVMAELQTQYETERKENIIDLQEQQLARQRTVQRFSVGVFALLGIIFFLGYSRYRAKRKANTLLAERARELEKAYTQLKATQAQLVQQEKMASLGQLTAGIAHEIKNPLNFINNFAEVNVEIADELREAYAANPDVKLADLLSVVDDLKQNAEVINQHGKRADGIVHAMMQHASGGTGQREATEINHLVSEHIDLAYHGKRAQRPDLAVEIKRDLDEEAGTVEVVPQEIGRVLLNLLGNAFDAVHEKADAETGYAPRVTVSTRRNGETVAIRIHDNGPGISTNLREKIFEPFFTTKPTGSGTGLGLSLSYDIVTHGHGGTLTVESEEGPGATFVVTLPVHTRETASSV